MNDMERKWVSQEGVKVYVREWKPDAPKAVLVLVHGLGEHICRYAHVAKALNESGYGLIGFDLPGHGRSGGARGHIPSYQVVMDLITAMLQEARKTYPRLPVFLYGHSMGGNMVLYYMLTQKPKLDGVICTSPGLGTAVPVPAWKVFAGKVLYRLAPSIVMDNGLDITGLAHGEEVMKAYQSDPLVHGKVSAQLGLDIINNGRWILEHAVDFPQIPLLLMQGSEDRVVDPKATQAFAEKCGNRSITFRMWEGGYHELHNDEKKEDALKTITTWLDRQITPDSRPSET